MGKTIALWLGIVFLLVGISGMAGGWGITGPDGIFHTDAAHDWVHLVSGIVFLLTAWVWPMQSGMVMKVFGVVYLLVAVLGFFGMSPVLGFIEVNTADNWLHLVLGVVILWLGVKAK